MNAVKFIEERNRMCGTMSEMWGVDAAQIVKNTEEWSAAHPRKTRQSEFLKLFPGAEPTKDGVLAICPNAFSPVYKDERGLCKWHYAECDNCCRKFWLAEVEDV